MIAESIQKLQRTFEVAPWLKDSKNAVTMSVSILRSPTIRRRSRN